MLLGIAATINVMAVDYTAKAKVRVSSTTGFYCDLMLSESAEYGALTGSPIYLPGYKVALYAINGTEQLQIARANSLNDVQLALKTDDGTDYTFTVSSVAGDETLYFMDALGENHALTEGASFTIYDLPANSTIEDRFTLGRPSAPAPTCDYSRDGLTIGRYYTICLPKAVENPTGASFWNLRYRNDEGTLAYLEEATGALVAGRPYIFQADDTELCFEYSGDAEPAGNFGALVGTFEEMDQDDLTAAGANIYLLYNNELWLVSGRTDNVLPENRAYIAYDELIPGNPASAPGRRVRAIPMQGQVATGIETLNAADAPAKTIIDGKLYIIRDKHMFDATGRLVK